MKNYIVAFLLSFLIFLAPINGLLLTMVGFVFFDTILACYVVWKLLGWLGFTSDNLFNIAVKLFFYLGAIILGYSIDTQIIQRTLFEIPFILSKTIALGFIYIEVKSIDETQMKLTNKSLWNFFKEGIEKAKSVKKNINEVIGK